MRRALPLVVAWTCTAACPSSLQAEAAPRQQALTASFIDGVYTMSARACTKLEALNRGATPSLGTVPWSLDRTGFTSWEGGCSFTRIEPIKGKSAWQVRADCHEAADESIETYLIERSSPSTLRITLTTPKAKPADRKPILYKRCDVKTGRWQ